MIDKIMRFLLNEKEQEVNTVSYEEEIKYNQEHLPSLEIPMNDPPYEKLDEFIKKTRFRFWEYDDRYEMTGENWKKIILPKNEFDADLIQFISILKEDMDWLDSHPLGQSIGEDVPVVRKFLNNKYHALSRESLERLITRYCHNNMW